MTNAAIKAGPPGLKRDFGEVTELQVSMKGPGPTFVSLADKRAEKDPLRLS